MKVLGLTCGRKMGNSEVLLREALMGTREASGADVEIIRLMDLNVDYKPCLDCDKCFYNRIANRHGTCMKNHDDVPFLVDKILESDGVILAAPCYGYRPPGFLLMIYDRLVRCGKKLAEKPIVKGVIAVGGSDMVGAMLPFLNRCPGGKMKLVDQMMVIWTARSGQILLNDEAIVRARKLGQNVGQAMKMPLIKANYVGEKVSRNLDDYYRNDYDLTTQLAPIYESCPVCHSELVRLRGKFVECPTCYMKGTIEVKDGVASFICDPVKNPSLYEGAAGRKRHDQDGLAVAEKLVQDKKIEIREKMKKYKADIAVTMPPAKVGSKTGT